MVGEIEAAPTATKKPELRTRQRSTIGFPYMPLDSAVELARAIHDNVSRGDCDDSQLAAWSGQSAKSSTFRVQVYAARMFGILDGEGGRHRLTPLGLAILDPNQERAARVASFLSVPLFKSVYEEYKNGTVPPAAAMERDMVRLGVSEKVKDRARQVFERSAEQAGFCEHGKNRLVMPGVPSGGTSVERNSDTSNESREDSGGGGNSLDPVIAALIQKLPRGRDVEWTADQRVVWLQMVSMAFDMAYGPSERIEVTKGVRS